MSELTDLIGADFAEISQDIPLTFTWQGADYVGSRSIIRKKNREIDPGFIVDFTLQVFALAAQFSTFPALGQQFTISGVNYRIVGINPDPSGNVLVYDLIDPTA